MMMKDHQEKKMRNIVEYPITFEEKKDVLKLCEGLLRRYVGDAIGGIEESALQEVIEDWFNYQDLRNS